MTNAEKVKGWRKRTKQRIIAALGGKCVCCEYHKSTSALCCHHLYGKDFKFASVMANPKSWQKLVIELRKCVLVCANCHAEIHEGLREVPSNAVRFIETFAS